jgi:hypothetical protein
MKTAACWLGWILAAVGSAQAQNFVNLGFEDIKFTSPAEPGTMLLTWDEAIPGWTHSEGDSTDVVYYLYPHAGYSQSYVLLPRDAGGPVSFWISGSFGVLMSVGTYFEQEPRGFDVWPFIEQRGLIPPGRTTLRVIANAPLGVTLDGVGLAMRPDALDPTSPTYEEDRLSYVGEWSADISSFAGQVVSLRVALNDVRFKSLFVDDIRFLPVPEPSSAALTLAGILVGVAVVRRRRCAQLTRACDGRRA